MDNPTMNRDHQPNPNEEEVKLIKQICEDIRGRRDHWKKPFDQWRKCQAFVRKGAEAGWSGATINIVQRYVRDRVANLYAKEPTTLWKRRKRMDFAVWDGQMSSLKAARDTMSAVGGALAAQGYPEPSEEQVEHATQVIQDFAAGMSLRARVAKMGETASIAYDFYRDQQTGGEMKPFKAMIRRGIVSAVGYVKPGFERIQKPKPEVEERINTSLRQLDEIRRRGEAQERGEIDDDSAEVVELQQMIAELRKEPQITVREGLLLHFPRSTSILPDKNLTDLATFGGCEQVAEEFVMSKEAAEAEYGIRITEHTHYSKHGTPLKDRKGDGMVLIWQNWNIRTGLVHTVCDGFDRFLVQDFAPPVQLDRFWPWFSFIPNPSDDEENPMPIPEIHSMIWEPQMEINRSFHGWAEARQAARPGTIGRKGTLATEDRDKIGHRKAFDHVELEIPDDARLADVMAPFPSTTFNPSMYEMGTPIQAIELSSGQSDARISAQARVSATASNISETAFQDQVASLRDELDDLNRGIARASGVIMMDHVSEEEMKRIVGRGALWSPLEVSASREQLFLDVEFGSSGRRNRQQQAAALRDLTPLLLQAPGFSMEKLVKLASEVLALGVEPMDLYEEGAPSIQAQNQAVAPAGAPPAAPPGPASTEPGGIV